MDSLSTAQQLMESFFRFHKLKWRGGPSGGLRHSEMAVLFCVKKTVQPGEPGMKVSELSTLLRVTPPSVTQMVNNMEAHGFVERNVDQQDRRSVRIKLTAEGEDATKRASDALQDLFGGLVEHLGDDHAHELIDLLSQVFAYFATMKDPHEI